MLQSRSLLLSEPGLGSYHFALSRSRFATENGMAEIDPTGAFAMVLEAMGWLTVASGVDKSGAITISNG